MSAVNLDRVLSPRSIAVIGSDLQPGQAGETLMRNLIAYPFAGKIYPVTRRQHRVGELKTYASLADLPEPVDLAIMTELVEMTPEIVAQCVRAEVGGAVILSPGGRRRTEKIAGEVAAVRDAARGSDLRLIGPGSTGIVISRLNLNAGLNAQMPLAGKTAFISQSGAICASVIDLSLQENFGFSHIISLGSMCDVDFGDIIDSIGNESGVNSLVMYVEHLTRIRAFMSAARAVSRIKPIIVLKAGRSRASSDDIYSAAFQRAGLLRVRTFEEMFDCAEYLAKHPTPFGTRLAVVTNAGGLGQMAADAAADYKIRLPELGTDLLQRLDRSLPIHWNRANPIDVQGDATPERYSQAVKACLESNDIDAVLLLLSPVALAPCEAYAEAVLDATANHLKPLFTAWTGGPAVDQAKRLFNDAGIITFDSPERAVRAFADMRRFAQNIESLQQIPGKHTLPVPEAAADSDAVIRAVLSRRDPVLTETEAERLLSAYGIAVDDRPPPDASADTSAGLLAAIRRDPNFGPVIFFGLGGKVGACVTNRSAGLPPLNRVLAKRVIEAAGVSTLWEDFPDSRWKDAGPLADLLIRLSHMAVDLPQLAYLVLDPLVAGPEGIRVLQAGATLTPHWSPSPDHLVISAYPKSHEINVDLPDLGEVLIRPIRPEDAPIFMDLFNSLSPRSVYMRFFSPVKRLEQKTLARFTQIDYDREIALVAIRAEGSDERMLGVARIIPQRNAASAEFSVLVGDAWQGKGVGAALLKQSLTYAAQMGIRKVWGTVLAENTQMLKLGRKLGFKISKGQGSSESEMLLKLDDPSHPDFVAGKFAKAKDGQPGGSN